MSSDLSSVAIPPPACEEGSEGREFPLGFEPLRSEMLAEMNVQTSEVVKDPFCSPLLAPDSMLKGLPPVHIVVRRSSSWRGTFIQLNTQRSKVTHPNLLLDNLRELNVRMLQLQQV